PITMPRVLTGRRSSSPAKRPFTRGSSSSQPVRKPRSPLGASSSTVTSSLPEPPGPRRHQATNASTRSGSPSNTASTVPSALVPTQPATPPTPAPPVPSALLPPQPATPSDRAR